MKRSFFALTFLSASLAIGCLEPNVATVYAPPTNQGSPSTDSSCQTSPGSVWLSEWYVTSMAARGNKVAFVAYPTLPKGGPDNLAPDQLGQLDLATGKIDWIVPLGKTADDYYSTRDLTIAPNGDVIVAATGYGEFFLGDRLGQFDGFVASFDTHGVIRFARRLEIHDVEPNLSYRPYFMNAKIIADDIIRVQTAFQVTDPGRPTIAPVHIFSFSPEGSQLNRVEVPIEPGSYNGYAWPVADGSLWVKVYPGPFRRYSKDGAVLDTLALQPTADFRGFAPISPTTALVNLTNKGYTNDLYLYDAGLPLTALFGEPTRPEFHAAAIVPTLGFEKLHFVEMKYDGRTYRFSSIDAKGNRGPATTVNQVFSTYTLRDDCTGVFFRAQETGTEFIVQQIE